MFKKDIEAATKVQLIEGEKNHIKHFPSREVIIGDSSLDFAVNEDFTLWEMQIKGK